MHTAMGNHIRRLTGLLAIATVIISLIAGCGGQDTSSGTPTSPATAAATITVSNFAFGAGLTVSPGATVTVVNKDSAPHNVVADDGSFKTADLKQGESATFTAPSTAGRYSFSCTIHPRMKGALVVNAAGASAPPAQDPGGGSGGY